MGREINLLMVSEDGIRHYTAIKSLSRLLSSKNSNTKRKQHFCMNCLQGFTQESSRDQHQVYCEDNESVRVEMPKQGSTVEFKDGQNQFKVPFIVYADFESILEPMGPQGSGFPNPNQPYTSEVKGNLRSKKSLAQMKEREKCKKKNEPSPTSMCQMVLEIFHFKVTNLSNMDVAIL